MIGGEIHYFRLDPRYWEAVLDAARKLGVDVIGTYVVWDFHERGEGLYDFALLHDFLDLTARKGFKVLARPGPFVYSEWRNLGVPDHAAPYHKQHPLFRKKAARWIKAVMKELAPRLDDPVIALQADNEIDPMLHFYGEDIGFAHWLAGCYGSVEKLNAAWGSSLHSFEEALPTLAPFRESPRFRDGCRYRYDLANDYARWVVKEYRNRGCTVPILLNTWPGVDAQNWADFCAIGDLFGIDLYPADLGSTGRAGSETTATPGDSPASGEFAFLRERLRLLRAVTDFPYISEFGSGHWREKGGTLKTYSPDHYRLTAWTALAAGVRGWNWYMLADRDNWTGAPINERGVLDPLLGNIFREAAEAFRSFEDAPPPEASCAVTWSWADRQAAETVRLSAGDAFFDTVHGMGGGKDPLLHALAQTGIEYDFFDTCRQEGRQEERSGTPTARRETPPILFFSGGSDASTDRDRLRAYVERGGNLVFFQRLCEGIKPPDGTSHPFARNLEISLGFEAQGPVFAYREVPGRPITATQRIVDTDEDTRILAEAAGGRTYITGYHENRGKGTITLLGCAPSREAILAVHRFLGVPISVLPITPGVHAVRRGDRIIVLNPGQAKIARLETGGVGDRGGTILTVDLPAFSGTALAAPPNNHPLPERPSP